MRWLAALGVILLAFGVFVFVEARGSTSADAEPEVKPRAPEATATETPPGTTTTQPSTLPRPNERSLASVVEGIRKGAAISSGGAAPSLAPTGEAAAGSGSAERAPDADDYLPYPDGSEPSSMRVKLRGALRRMNNGNYKGAFEAANSQIELYPDLWEAYGIAVPSLCAMGDDRAATYFGRVTDEDTKKQIIDGCAGFGVKL